MRARLFTNLPFALIPEKSGATRASTALASCATMAASHLFSISLRVASTLFFPVATAGCAWDDGLAAAVFVFSTWGSDDDVSLLARLADGTASLSSAAGDTTGSGVESVAGAGLANTCAGVETICCAEAEKNAM